MWRREAEREYEKACLAYLYLVCQRGSLGRFKRLEAAGDRIARWSKQVKRLAEAEGDIVGHSRTSIVDAPRGHPNAGAGEFIVGLAPGDFEFAERSETGRITPC